MQAFLKNITCPTLLILGTTGVSGLISEEQRMGLEERKRCIRNLQSELVEGKSSHTYEQCQRFSSNNLLFSAKITSKTVK